MLQSESVHAPAQADENVFRVLAGQARRRSLPELWITAVGGAVDAGLLWWQHPMLSWLAAGCAAMAAYGIWGLLDRAIRAEKTTLVRWRATVVPLVGLRDFTTLLGTGAAVWAVLSFMARALANWNH